MFQKEKEIRRSEFVQLYPDIIYFYLSVDSCCILRSNGKIVKTTISEEETYELSRELQQNDYTGSGTVNRDKTIAYVLDRTIQRSDSTGSDT